MKVNNKADKAKVIIAKDIKPQPEPHEVEVAEILAKELNCEVRFIKRRTGYKANTPDIEMLGVEWEIKSPLGDSQKHTIQDQMRRASKQSRNVIIDGRNTKLSDAYIQKVLKQQLNVHKDIKRLLFITKAEKVIAF